MPDSDHGDGGQRPPRVDPRRLAGSTLAGKYELERLLGAGGYGAVYLGVHKVLGGKVAVKVLLSQGKGGSDEFSQRFRREAATLSRLRHPHIVEVLDFGEESGIEYVVLEYVDGRSLSDLVHEDGPLPWERAIGITRRIALALAAAHGIGVVHRDLKPANIMIEDLPGAPDHVQVLDFGIAKIVDPASDIRKADDAKTRVGLALGTPRYMSPEQCRGKQLDGRSDLYGLGILLFEMLTGYRPFDGNTPMDILAAHMHDPVPPIEPPEDNPPIPPALQRLVERLLAKDPDDRPEGAEATVGELDVMVAQSAPVVVSAGTPIPAGLQFPATPSGGTPFAGEQVAALLEEPEPRRLPMKLIGGLAGGLTAVVGLVVLLVVVLGGSDEEEEARIPAVRVVVTSKPQGADVRLDGKVIGETPLATTLEGPAATLAEKARYELKRKGQAPAKFTLNVKEDGDGAYVRGHAVFEETRAEPEPEPEDSASTDERGKGKRKGKGKGKARKKRKKRRKRGVSVDLDL